MKINKEELYKRLETELENKFHFLEDKPEETIESTIKALWLKACGISKSTVEAVKHTLPDISGSQLDILNDLIKQRLNQVPLSHLTGRQSFMGIELLSDNRALIPRKETELLGEKALEITREISQNASGVKVIDACCGSGNLGLAIAFFNPKAVVYSSDLSHEAVELTRENITLLNLENRVHVKQGDLLSAFEEDEFFQKINLIVCNPPYITSAKVGKMNEEIIANEPKLAFDGGMLGIKIIQRLIREAPQYLAKEGWLAFEVGLGQGPFIINICKKTGLYSQVKSGNDSNGNIRMIYAQKK